jgi:hypothetical protein
MQKPKIKNKKRRKEVVLGVGLVLSVFDFFFLFRVSRFLSCFSSPFLSLLFSSLLYYFVVHTTHILSLSLTCFLHSPYLYTKMKLQKAFLVKWLRPLVLLDQFQNCYILWNQVFKLFEMYFFHFFVLKYLLFCLFYFLLFERG